MGEISTSIPHRSKSVWNLSVEGNSDNMCMHGSHFKALSMECDGPPELMIQTPNNDPQMHAFVGMGLQIATQIS
ncbi:hypothetical protein VNO77_44676 [Canavalia gladiata]|uniref:Uncharacterized protein n=1 Tax=Canavalia gladiata TaxID=3824 RepID=A0AAN9JYW3_CANGL